MEPRWESGGVVSIESDVSLWKQCINNSFTERYAVTTNAQKHFTIFPEGASAPSCPFLRAPMRVYGMKFVKTALFWQVIQLYKDKKSHIIKKRKNNKVSLLNSYVIACNSKSWPCVLNCVAPDGLSFTVCRWLIEAMTIRGSYDEKDHTKPSRLKHREHNNSEVSLYAWLYATLAAAFASDPQRFRHTCITWHCVRLYAIKENS